VYGKFTGGAVSYTIKDRGVDIAPFHDYEGKIPGDLKSEIDAIRNALSDGSLTIDGVLQTK